MQHTKDEVRIKILNAALREFSEHGYTDASIRNISLNSKVSLGNIYRYFLNKDALFLAVVNPVLEICIAHTDSDFDLSPTSLDQTAENMVNYVLKNRVIFEMIQSGPTAYYSAFITNLGNCVSRKIEQYIANKSQNDAMTMANPRFFYVIATCYISGLRSIMEQPITEKKTKQYVKELLHYLFDDLEQRINRIKEEPNSNVENRK